MQRFYLLWIFLLSAPAVSAQKQVAELLRNGDIIFQETKSAQSKAIKLATHSRYSHVGIVYFQKGRPVVFEAVQPVKATNLKTFLSRSVGGHYVVKRLKNADATLTKQVLARMEKEGRKFLGKNYDWIFGWSDARIYCSELVWKIYQRGAGIELSPTKKLREFDLSHPAVRAKMKERYGTKIPLDEPVVAPGQLFESELLETVYESK
ncbi:MAG: YiiX family permuted papain-like enzyme [Turneriella sp.]